MISEIQLCDFKIYFKSFKSFVWKTLKHKIKELLFAECPFIPLRKTVKKTA